jgi:hypothetical protein
MSYEHSFEVPLTDSIQAQHYQTLFKNQHKVFGFYSLKQNIDILFLTIALAKIIPCVILERKPVYYLTP